jgi:uncharacterized protein (TIGR02301 family)
MSLRRSFNIFGVALAFMAGASLMMPAAQAQTAQRPGGARTSSSAPVAAPAVPPPEQDVAPQPYEPDLLKLAEIIGSMAFLRTICEGQEKGIWPARMTKLIEAEGRTQAIKERLAGAYNRGFSSYALVHRECTSVAREAGARLARDGDELSRKLANRFGG